MPDHVEKHPGGFALCRHCGGEVGDDGFSMGGELEASLEGVTDEPVEQGEAAEELREAAFADAISKRRGAR